MKEKKGSVYSKPCSKVVLLQQMLSLGYKTFGCTCSQTENERNMLKQQIQLLSTLLNWSAIVILSLNFEVGSQNVKNAWFWFQESYFLFLFYGSFSCMKAILSV